MRKYMIFGAGEVPSWLIAGSLPIQFKLNYFNISNGELYSGNHF